MENETKRIMPLSFVVCGTCGKRSWKGGGTRAAGTAHARQRGRKDSFWPHVPSQHSQNTYIICEGIYICNMYIYIYNQPRYLRISVFPIMQLNSNATPLRICPHFVLICFLPIWPLLWKPLYTSMQPVSAFFSSSFHILIWFFITLCSEK